MKLLEGVTAATSFRTLPNTILLIIIYAVVFASVFITDELPDVPKKKNRQGLDLDQAMQDLHYITTRPHPYNSHSNDEVRAYILGRIRNILLFSGTHPNSVNATDSSLVVPSYAKLANDLYSNGSWASEVAPAGVYFEGTNILVKIEGTDPEFKETGGLLFSAHYDSVSTAPGVTDDGMGIVTLLQLIKWYVSEEGRPQRTVVFNLNNGEEDWLNGAHAFLEHPWSKITDTFINLEGAASGGRPMLFRATSTEPLHAFHIPHPHANVLSADAFARGVIRSGTDYSVYTTPLRSIDPSAGPGPLMHGVDIAFYKGRSRYHTKYDAVPWLEGGKKAAWAMMEAAKSAGDVLANEGLKKREIKGEALGAGDKAVYFDLFGSALVLFRLKSLLTFNVVTLIVGPILMALLLLCASVIQPPGPHEREQHVYNELTNEEDDAESILRRAWTSFKEHNWAAAIWMWGKFWAALGVGVGVQAALIYGYLELNPFIVYSHPYVVLLTTVLLTFLAHTTIFSLPNPKPSQSQTHPGYNYGYVQPNQPQVPAQPPTYGQINGQQQQQLSQQLQQQPPISPFDPDQEKQTSLWQTYLLSWVLLLLATLAVAKVEVGGLYIFSIWNLLLGAACIIGIAQNTISPTVSQQYAKKLRGVLDENGQDRQVRFQSRGSGEYADDRSDTSSDDSHSHRNIHINANETTPLIAGAARRWKEKKEGEEEGAVGWWIAQLLLAVPIPLILVAHLMVILLDALPQTLADGSPPAAIYTFLAGLSFFIILPLAPFASRIHKGVVVLVALVLVITTCYLYTIFPFSTDVPLKIYFQQKVELDLNLDLRVSSLPHLNIDNTTTLSPDAWSMVDSGVRSGSVSTIGTRAMTYITGAKYYVKKKIVPKIPSAREAEEINEDYGIMCSWGAAKVGLYTCGWESQLLPQPGDGVKRITSDADTQNIATSTEAVLQDIYSLNLDVPSSSSTGPNPETVYLTTQISRRGRNTARFRLTGTNTRSCRIYFDNRPILTYYVHGGQMGMQPGYQVPPQGLSEIRLWSRTWEREFVVDVHWGAYHDGEGMWDDDEEGVRGRVACEWNEYESGSVGHWTGGKIPALEEIFEWLPKWAVVTKATDGLVEVWAPFVL
ncbi:hypothetical protein AX16_002983 [Volvariella volvacea WC 439]|nr:hypothetical protein AX16_002983 [Volvariella volvacea WC 439]